VLEIASAGGARLLGLEGRKAGGWEVGRVRR
jgi:hypothetical protein